jgi:hypothetical protein
MVQEGESCLQADARFTESSLLLQYPLRMSTLAPVVSNVNQDHHTSTEKKSTVADKVTGVTY